ncbi:hypothetical protein, variant 1 [Phytophthora nicotianae INRA-310]|uniref:Uncharacterized protein n=1 Tax=Phytophthora nicotianae (strain INRA-310) TaxID=761204 RepID=W2QVQ8_PHYN3|nr:hypothetical protein, variant 1 [Phytophthora nicotianae INRA-310]ETN17026.1 hypothetical protein, variant 1 [Phytophthora nicotianae INRA-310]
MLQAFVAGDPRGHRVSKVLRIDRKEDEFPIRVDTQEMLPLTIMLKRKRDRNDVEISSDDAKWRKLRTYRLVDGEVEGETRADRLNADLKKGLADAMKATKKQLAKEKEEKANAGSKKVMSNYFTKLSSTDEGETTSSQRSSIDAITTPERKKKKRKPLTPRDNTDHYSSSRPHDKSVFKKSRSDEKYSRKNRPEDDTAERKFKYDKQESCKRKRSESTPKKINQTDAAPKKSQERISRFFGAEQKQRQVKKKTSLKLKKFVNHAEEKDVIKDIEKKKRTVWGLDEYIALDGKKKELEAETNAELRDNPGKKVWSEQRTNYRKKNEAGGSLKSWLKPLGSGKRKNELEDISGTPTKPQRSKQRALNLGADKQNSPKMDRKNLSFLLSNRSADTDHRPKEAKHSTNRDDLASREHGQLRKKRKSLGIVSARTPKQTNQWYHRKIPH